MQFPYRRTSHVKSPAQVADAHAKGLTAGFYTNNYEDVRSEAGWSKTPELRALHMKGEADFLAAMLYDEVKVDSGGEFNDMDWWARELNATGRAIAVENCHQGHIIPNASWCPFQMWRTSGDPAAIGWQYEMADTAPLLFLSRPGCWAYPGYTLFKQSMQDQYTNDSRSQFGVHCVTSSPLILSFDITAASPRLDNHWSVLSNREAIEVNQRWAGSAGALIRQWNPYAANTSAQLFLWAEACNSTAAAITGWQVNTGDGAVRVTVAADGKRDTVDNDGISVSPRVAPLCLQRDGSNVGVRECNSTDPNQAFTFDDSTGGIRIPAQASDISESGTDCIQIQAASSFQMGPAVGFADCNAGGSTRTRGGRQFALLTGGNAAGGHMVADNGTGVCLVARRARPNSFGPMQLWSKPLGNGSAAVFVLATADGVWSNSNPDAQVAIVALAEIPGLDTSRGSVKVRDIWNGADLPSISGGDKSQLVTDAIAPGDSRFFLLSPGTTPAMAA